MTAKTPPTIDEILAARDRIAPHVHVTPVETCATLDRLAGCRVVLKCENLQKGGAFKARGATNAVFALDRRSAERGVCTHSSGNHAGALARAAALRGIPAHIVMPSTAPRVKVAAVEGYGGRITFCEPTLTAREATLERVVEATGATFVHPYDEPLVLAGQGTCALELVEQAPEVEVVMAPVGGGGLASGCAVALAACAPDARLVGAEPAAADDARRSLELGRIVPSEDPRTVADGLRTALSPLTFAVLSGHGVEILTATEEGIVAATRLLWERAKLVVEPSGAVPLAVLLAHRERFAGRTVGLVLSGGNVDLDRLPWTTGRAGAPDLSPGAMPLE